MQRARELLVASLVLLCVTACSDGEKAKPSSAPEAAAVAKDSGTSSPASEPESKPPSAAAMAIAARALGPGETPQYGVLLPGPPERTVWSALKELDVGEVRRPTVEPSDGVSLYEVSIFFLKETKVGEANRALRSVGAGLTSGGGTAATATFEPARDEEELSALVDRLLADPARLVVFKAYPPSFGPAFGQPSKAEEATPDDRRDATIGRHVELKVGQLAQEAIDRVFRESRAQTTYCYERELAKTPGISGSAKVQLLIMRSGTARQVKVVESTLNNRAVEVCLVDRVRKWRFPKPTGGDYVLVERTLEFPPR